MKQRLDLEWIDNAYQHVVWKLSSYSRIVHLDCSAESAIQLLNPSQIIYEMNKKYNKEFIKGKQSFFQRVI